jgi:hypothetical protein
MKLSSMKSKNGKRIFRLLLGATVGAFIGIVASGIASTSGSQCTILCNQAMAIPYFTAVGLLVAWR